MLTYMFPGQGAQRKGMGEKLFDEFAELTAQADEILGYSIKELCTVDSNLQLNQTQYTQPALFIVNALSYMHKLKVTGTKPDFVAGHSLGEYNALFAAGVFDFATGIRLVKKRGELMSLANGGGMAAVIGLRAEQIQAVLEQNKLANIDIANYNSPTQIVIAGLKKDIECAKTVFEIIKEVQSFILLKTSGAFHSRYMESAKQEFELFLDKFHFFEPEIPVISNVTARPYQSADIKQNLVKQITSPVKWTETIRYLLGMKDMVFEEIGIGKVLTGLVKKITQEVQPLIINEIQRADINPHPQLSVELPQAVLQYQIPHIEATALGCSEFKREYNLRYAYLAGGMYQGISSKELVIKLAKQGMMGFLGTSGLEVSVIAEAITFVQKVLSPGNAYGVNLVYNPTKPEMEEKIIELLLETGVKHIETSAYLDITAPLVRYRAKGLSRNKHGHVVSGNKLIAKITRPELAEVFLKPAPERLLIKLLAQKAITEEQANQLKTIPMADDICVEADSGGRTEGISGFALVPLILRLRDEVMERRKYTKKIRVGVAGGIGTPDAAASAFMLGADFIMTGSINQCTVEAATSELTKDLLQEMGVQDTAYVPDCEVAAVGSKVQVLKKGNLFPARAKKLYDLYQQYNSLNEIDERSKRQIEEKFFKCSLEKVYEMIKTDYSADIIEIAESNPRYKMALVFTWYSDYTKKLALSGNAAYKVEFQIHCGPALGAFNQWVKGTPFENWRNRHVNVIALKLMEETAKLFNQQYLSLFKACKEYTPA